MAANPGPGNSSHIDGNQQFSIIGVAGTLGTSDAGGTADTVPIGVNAATGAMYVQDLSGASGTTNVMVVGGTLNAGTVSVGSIANVGQVHNAGTLAAGDNNIGNVDVVTGTVTSVTAVTTVSNLTNGSVNILSGTVQSSGTTTGVGVVSNLTNGSVNVLTGTIQSSGTVTGVGVVSSLTVGTVGGKAASGAAAVANPVQIAGTDAGGTIYSPLVTTAGALTIVDVPKGTITLVSGLNTGTITTIAAGTQNTLGTVGTVSGVGVVTTVTTVSNLTNGSVNLLTGTLTRASNIGTVESGTIQINPDPVPTMLVMGTLGTAGGSFFGTLSAASGAGTKHFVSGVDVVMDSGTADVRILAGTAIQGTGVLAAGKFSAGGGISKIFNPAFETGTNSELTYHFVGAGTAFIHVSYWKGT